MTASERIRLEREYAAHREFLQKQVASVHGYLTAADIDKRDRLETLLGISENDRYIWRPTMRLERHAA